jgi:hypothetical protein
MYAIGKSVIQLLSTFRVRRWYTSALYDLVAKTIEAVQYRNEIVSGGIVTEGTVSPTVMKANISSMASVLKGRIMAAGVAADLDLLVAGGQIGQPLFEDGSDATSFVTLGASEHVRATLIVTNSDGAGGAVETDAGTPKFVAVFAGTTQATAKAATAFLTSVEIQAALDASTGVHDGVTAWQHVADLLFARAAGPGATTLTPTANRNNVIRAA